MYTNNAYDDVIAFLDNDEEVEAVVFGPWGWGSSPNEEDDWDYGFMEPGEGTEGEPAASPFVPFDRRGVVLSWDEAQQYMQGWSFYGGHGSPDCYATYIWTNKNVLWVTQYDGATGLDSMPRHPFDVIPNMPGG